MTFKKNCESFGCPLRRSPGGPARLDVENSFKCGVHIMYNMIIFCIHARCR